MSAHLYSGLPVVIITTPISTWAHREDISWGRHLIVYSSQSWSHFICQSTSNNHQVRLTGSCTENNTESIHIITWCSEVHHLDSTTSETENLFQSIVHMMLIENWCLLARKSLAKVKMIGYNFEHRPTCKSNIRPCYRMLKVFIGDV